MCLGESFAGFDVKRPRGVVLVSVEDDHEEMHRRMFAALAARFGNAERAREIQSTLERRLRIVNLRGAGRVGLGQDLRDRLLRVVDLVEDPGWISLDPLSRLLPDNAPPGFLNSQEGAGLILNEFDALRTQTGCSVIGSHHVNKEAIRNDGELKGGAATGSQLLADLSRWVLSLKPLTAKEAAEYGRNEGHFLEAGVTKTNYTPPMGGGLVFRRVDGGALVHVEVQGKADRAEEAMLRLLMSAEQWITRETWLDLADENDLAKHAANTARAGLEASGKVERVNVRAGRKTKTVFAPARYLRPERWPAAPARIEDVAQGGS
jgi:hypothetical protein